MALFLEDISQNNSLFNQRILSHLSFCYRLCIISVFYRKCLIVFYNPLSQLLLALELQDPAMIDLSLVMQIFLKLIVNFYSMLQVHLHPAFNLVPLSIL